MKFFKKRRWPLAIGIIFIVVIISGSIIYTNRVNSADKISVQAVSDGQGGMIALWKKGYEIHSQRIDFDGKTVWRDQGILISAKFIPSTPHWQPQISLIEDNTGGVIATWDDRSSLSDNHSDPTNFSSLPVYSQKLNANGAPLWGDGIPTGTTQNLGDALSRPVSAGDGGIIFVYNDFKVVDKALHDDFYYLQKVNSEGWPIWGEKGILLYSSPPFRPVTSQDQGQGIKGTWFRDKQIDLKFSVVSDQTGGALLVWREENPGQDNITIYVQHYDTGGKPLWAEKGIQVFYGPNMDFKAVSDGNGGLFVVNDRNNRMVVQRISPEGEFLWASTGIVVPVTGFFAYNSQVVIFSAGSPVIFWGQMVAGGLTGQDNAVRLDSAGRIMWQKTAFIRPVPHLQDHQLYVYPGNNALYLTWSLSEYDFYQTGSSRIIAQKMDGDGNLLWGEKGRIAFPDGKLKYQSDPQIVSDGTGDAVILGLVGRSILQGDTVSLQKLSSSGNLLWGKGIKIFR